jgi:hypothetical protein
MVTDSIFVISDLCHLVGLWFMEAKWSGSLNARPDRRLTTHSTGARIALLLSLDLALLTLPPRPVNSGVRRYY